MDRCYSGLVWCLKGKLGGVGMNAQVRNYTARSCFVLKYLILIKSEFLVGLIVGAAVGARGMFHIPLDGLLGPLITSFPFFEYVHIVFREKGNTVIIT